MKTFNEFLVQHLKVYFLAIQLTIKVNNQSHVNGNFIFNAPNFASIADKDVTPINIHNVFPGKLQLQFTIYESELKIGAINCSLLSFLYSCKQMHNAQN